MKDGENETLDAQDGMISVDANLKANLGCIKRIYYGDGEPRQDCLTTGKWFFFPLRAKAGNTSLS